MAFGKKPAEEQFQREMRAYIDQQLATIERRLARNLEDSIASMRTRINDLQISLSNGSLTINELVQLVMLQMEAIIQKRISELARFDPSDISSDVYNDVDMDELYPHLAEVLKLDVFKDIDRGELLTALADKLIEDYIDTDDVSSEVAETIAARLVVSLRDN